MARHNNIEDDVTQHFLALSISGPSQGRSPIDQYFYRHAEAPKSKFTYSGHTNLNIRKTFANLAKVQKWGRKKRGKEQEEFFSAIDSEFTTRIGDGNSLPTWQRLIVMLGYDGPAPSSITKCRKILSGYFINIYDFMDYCRREGVNPEDGVDWDLSSLNKGSLENLRAYSKSGNPRLLYPLDCAKGTVLKAFLVHMF